MVPTEHHDAPALALQLGNKLARSLACRVAEAEEDDAVEDALDEVGSALLLDEDELLDSLELLLEELLHSLVELHVDVVSGVQVEVGVQVVDGSCQVEVVVDGGGGSLVVAGAPSPYSQEPCRTPASVLEKYSKRP